MDQTMMDSESFDKAIDEAMEIEVPGDPATFQSVLGKVQMMKDRDWLEVTDRLFDFLSSNTKPRYIMYGNPGVKVFRQGTREEIEWLEGRTIDQVLRGETYVQEKVELSKARKKRK